MATVGQALTSPESGWKRIDDTNINISKTTFNILNNSSAYNGSCSGFAQDTQSEATFNFVGTKLRIISVANTSSYRAPKISIYIDGAEEQYTEIMNGVVWQCLVYEKTGLENKEHYVKIKGLSTQAGATFYLDAIDIDSNGEIKSYKEIKPLRKMIIKNPTTDNYYSLSDNTLIHLPNSTSESIIEHGIEQGKYIQLDTPFTKHRYFNDTPVANVNSGKVFTHDVGVINTLSIKELVKNNNFESIFNWYETNMTANNAPSPLVASASDQQTGFETYKAFNNLNTASDTWMTNSNIVNGWIQLDLGSSMIFNCVRITSRNGVGYVTLSPKDFEILASNDNNTFTKLGTFNSNTAWKNYEQRAFTFSNTTAYRYYRVDVLSNNGGVIVAINNISFGYKREVS